METYIENSVLLSRDKYEEYKGAWEREKERSATVHEEALKIVNEMSVVPVRVELGCEPVTSCGCQVGSTLGVAEYDPGTSQFKFHDDLKNYIDGCVRDRESENLRTYAQTVENLCDTFNKHCQPDKSRARLVGGFIIGLITGAIVTLVFNASLALFFS